jgi:hypothetical protein
MRNIIKEYQEVIGAGIFAFFFSDCQSWQA